MKKIICLLLILPCFLIIASREEDAIKQRLVKVGNVCIQGEDCSALIAAVSFEKPLLSSERSGIEVYKTACTTCHSIGLAGAPKFGDKSTWGNRQDKGIEALVVSVMNGLNGMPKMGLCMDCTKEEMNLAVDYMLSELK